MRSKGKNFIDRFDSKTAVTMDLQFYNKHGHRTAGFYGRRCIIGNFVDAIKEAFEEANKLNYTEKEGGHIGSIRLNFGGMYNS